MKGSASVLVIIQTEKAKIAVIMKSPIIVPLSFFLMMSGSDVQQNSPGSR